MSSHLHILFEVTSLLMTAIILYILLIDNNDRR